MTEHDIQSEERLLYGIIAATSAPVLLGAMVTHAPFDGGITLTLVVFALAMVGFVTSIRRRSRRLPRAQSRRT